MDHPVVVGIAFAVAVSTVIIIVFIIFFVRALIKWSKNTNAVKKEATTLPLRLHGVNSSVFLSDKNPQHQHMAPYPAIMKCFPFFRRSRSRKNTSGSSHHRIMRFTYKDLQKATENFTTIIGKGAFGPVYKAMLPSTAVVAVKVLGAKSKQGEKEFQNEVMLLGRLHHKNLVTLVGFCSEGGHRLLAYDYMPNGSLAKRLHDPNSEVLSWGQRVSIAHDIARGIEYLHDGVIPNSLKFWLCTFLACVLTCCRMQATPPVIHRDIKASNILLDSFMAARVADFGLSKEAESEMPASGIRGTYGYLDPEYITTNNLTYRSDVYSFGVLLFEIISGKSPKDGLMESVEELVKANEGREVWLQLLDPRLEGACNLNELGAMALIATQCVELEARKRPKMREVVQALARLGPRSESTRLDFLKLASSKALGTMDRMGKAVTTKVSSMIEGRG